MAGGPSEVQEASGARLNGSVVSGWQPSLSQYHCLALPHVCCHWRPSRISVHGLTVVFALPLCLPALAVQHKPYKTRRRYWLC